MQNFSGCRCFIVPLTLAFSHHSIYGTNLLSEATHTILEGFFFFFCYRISFQNVSVMVELFLVNEFE